MKTVSISDPGVARAAASPAGDPFAHLTTALKKLDALPVLQNQIKELSKENKELWATIDKLLEQQASLAATVSGLSQYRKEHAGVHAVLDKSAAAAAKASETALRQLHSSHSEAMSKMHEMLVAVSSKSENAPVIQVPKQDAPVVNLPAPNIDLSVSVERGPWDFDVQRDAKGLIQSVVASPRDK